MFEDPKALTSVEWNNIHLFLQWFWIYSPIVVTFGVTMLTAHAFIPSLIHTGQLPESANRLRAPLTGFAAMLVIAGVILLILVVNSALDVRQVYNRFLI
ncbi:MAG: hypothetical protein O3A93_05435 [Chloroflexi bacterium]|nr:hypothetical protein [Chloroflexota bacterium]MDA1270685.1 hypothetical protein [Chloroflexota bacterium]PKB59545.1 MAG: hypothetical protein BZY83_01150 [SAR202 cluster bacterium Casp-Chloro-G2]